MAGGRPRTVSLPQDEMIALGKEMIEWIKLNHPLHISEFYSIEKEILFSEWETMIKKPEFVKYYEQALNLIGKQYLDKNSDVREGASQRWQRVYFKDLRKEEDEKEQRKIDKDIKAKKELMDYESNLKSQEENPKNAPTLNLENLIMDKDHKLTEKDKRIEELEKQLNDYKSKTE